MGECKMTELKKRFIVYVGNSEAGVNGISVLGQFDTYDEARKKTLTLAKRYDSTHEDSGADIWLEDNETKKGWALEGTNGWTSEDNYFLNTKSRIEAHEKKRMDFNKRATDYGRKSRMPKDIRVI